MNEWVSSAAKAPDTETKKPRLVKNSDNDHLFLDPMFEGYYVDEVNGAGAEEVAGYVPTRHELVQLVKYWYGRLLDDDWFRFLYGGPDSREFRIARFGPRRIRRAAAAIGEEAINQTIKEVREEFKAKVNDADLWDIFENGTAEQWAAVRDESWREIFEQDAAEALKRLEHLEKESPGEFVALVLRHWSNDKVGPILISTTHSELNAVLQASGIFEVETDKSRIRALIVDQHLTSMGFLRATRHKWGLGV